MIAESVNEEQTYSDPNKEGIGILEYNILKDRKDSTRFAKGQSETFSTLEGLVAKGVKVDIAIPHELWRGHAAQDAV